MKNLIIFSIVVLATCRSAQAGFFGLFSSAPEVEETTTQAPEESEDSNDETLTRYFQSLGNPFTYPAVPVYYSQPIVRNNPFPLYPEQPIIYYAPPPQTYEVVQRQQQIPITYTNVVQQYQQAPPAPSFVRQSLPYAINEYPVSVSQPSVQSVERLIQAAPPQQYQQPAAAPFVRQPLPYADFREYSVPAAQTVEKSVQVTEEPSPAVSKFAPAPPTPSPKFTSASQEMEVPSTRATLDFKTGGYLTGTYTNPTYVAPSTSFGHAYDNSDGTRVAERGQVIQFGDGTETVVKTGQYEYIDPNGKTVNVKWIADDEGYRVIN